LLSVS
jgi:hypothetical protein